MSASMGKEMVFATKCVYGIRRSIHFLSNNVNPSTNSQTKLLEVSDMMPPYACFTLTTIRNLRKLVPTQSTEPDRESDDFLGIASDIQQQQQQQQSSRHVAPNLSVDVKRLFHKKVPSIGMKTPEKVIQTNFGYIRRDTDNTSFRKRYRRRETTVESDLRSQVTYMFSLFSGMPVKRLSPAKSNIDEVNNGLLNTIPASLEGTGYQPMTRRERRQKNRELPSLDEGQNEGQCSQRIVNEQSSDDIPNKSMESANQDMHTDLNYFDADYFGNYLANKRSASKIKQDTQLSGSSEQSGHVSLSKPSETGSIANLNYVDAEYFGNYAPKQRPVEVQNKFHSDTNDVTSEDVHKESDIPNYVDECFLDAESKYLKTKHSEKKLEVSEGVTDINDETHFLINNKPETSDEPILGGACLNEDLTEYRNVLSAPVVQSTKPVKRSSQSTILGKESELVDNSDIVRQKRKSLPVAFNIETPDTAYDVVMKMRLEKAGRVTTVEKAKAAPEIVPAIGERLDTHGFRILTDQVQDWRKIPRHAVTKLLKDSIIFERGDIIALNKPYGLASHGGPGVVASVGQYLSELAKVIDSTGKLDTLHLIHRLDKETTGVMLLAKTPHMAWRLHKMFLKRQVIKKYWVITKGVPNPLQGVIDIPIAEGTVEGKYRMVLKPKGTEETRLVMTKSQIKPFEAITHYRVLDSANSTALVECQPESGIKHQIRAHLAFGLNTPVLGDHKYSHLTKIAPQRLYADTLQKLGVRQSKVRTLPMHLHASVLILPEFEDGRNIIISSRLPKHFVRNMQRLKIKPPK